MENLLITGASGFIGKNFIEIVKEHHQFNIIAFIKENDILGKNQLERLGVKDFITESDLDKCTKKIDFCLHLASYGVQYSDRNIETMLNVNINLSAKIMKFCANHNCKLFVNTGSCFEYGTQVTNTPITEEQECNPDDIYASSKLANEVFLNTYSKILNQKMITIRPFNIYGKYENENRLLPLIFKHGIKKEPLELTNGNQIRDYLNVTDVCIYIYNLILNHQKLINNEIINICSNNPISVRTFIEKIIEICGFDSSLFLFGSKESRKNESLYFVGSNKKLINYTSYVVNPNDFPEKIKEIFKSYKETYYK